MASGLSKFLFGSKPRREQIPLYSDQQQQLLSQLLGQAQQQLGQPFRPTQEVLQPVFGQARKQFQEQTIPGLLEQFSAGGVGGSGALQSALAKSAQNLEGQLASMGAQAELGREGQQMQFLSNLLGFGLRPQFETVEYAGSPGALEGLASGLAFGGSQAAGQLLPQLLSGLGGGSSGSIGQQAQPQQGGGFGQTAGNIASIAMKLLPLLL